nr:MULTISPECIES: hypothetical protein [unclassified Paraburkholderia]
MAKTGVSIEKGIHDAAACAIDHHEASKKDKGASAAAAASRPAGPYCLPRGTRVDNSGPTVA